MIRELILGNTEVKLLALSLIVLSCGIISPISYATEQINTKVVDKTTYIEIEVLPDLVDESDQSEFLYAKSTVTDFKSESLDSRDILSAIPSITTQDNKTMGLVIPPFAYFKTRF